MQSHLLHAYISVYNMAIILYRKTRRSLRNDDKLINYFLHVYAYENYTFGNLAVLHAFTYEKMSESTTSS